jgi:hypothetical protein
MVALNGCYSLEASAERKCRTSVQMHTENVELDSNEAILMNQKNLMICQKQYTSRTMLT